MSEGGAAALGCPLLISGDARSCCSNSLNRGKATAELSWRSLAR